MKLQPIKEENIVGALEELCEEYERLYEVRPMIRYTFDEEIPENSRVTFIANDLWITCVSEFEEFAILLGEIVSKYPELEHVLIKKFTESLSSNALKWGTFDRYYHYGKNRASAKSPKEESDDIQMSDLDWLTFSPLNDPTFLDFIIKKDDKDDEK